MSYYKKSNSKYGNVKTTVDGIVFDSLLEASHYRVLKKLVDDGSIVRFDRQETIVLVPSFKRPDSSLKSGTKTERPITMKPDFTVYMPCGAKVYLESKGIETEDYKIKKKLMYYLYPGICYVLAKKPDTTRLLKLLQEQAETYVKDVVQDGNELINKEEDSKNTTTEVNING